MSGPSVTIEMAGQRFGRWTVLHRVPAPRGKSAWWLCRCDCGVERPQRGATLRIGHTQSCGCWRDEKTSVRFATHRKSGSREYMIWGSIVNRCTNPNNPDFASYGGRGVGLAPEWRTFDGFIRDMGPMPTGTVSIDRIDNDRGYEPGNCRWTTWTQQARNRRNTRFVVVHGERLSVSDAVEKYSSVSYYTVRSRLHRGWPDERAVLAAREGR